MIPLFALLSEESSLRIPFESRLWWRIDACQAKGVIHISALQRNSPTGSPHPHLSSYRPSQSTPWRHSGFSRLAHYALGRLRSPLPNHGHRNNLVYASWSVFASRKKIFHHHPSLIAFFACNAGQSALCGGSVVDESAYLPVLNMLRCCAMPFRHFFKTPSHFPAPWPKFSDHRNTAKSGHLLHTRR